MNKKLTCLFAALLAVCVVFAQTYSPDVEKKIKEVEEHLGGAIQIAGHPWFTLKERMAYYHVHGLSIAVVHNYKVEWARGYGWADSAEKRPVGVQTLFQAASISKSLNGVGLLRLAQEKKIDLYADINTYLSSWKFPYDSLSRGKKISVANLLSHTAGLTVHGFPGYEGGVARPSVVQVLNGAPPANTQAVRSMYAPGIKSEYSGGGTTISQLIVTDVTHEAYDQWMSENVLQPLGMTGSFYTQPAPAEKAALLATAYHADGSAVPGKYHIYPEEAPAGLWTNPTDLCKYIIETQLSYEGRSAKVLNQSFTRLRLTPYVDSSAALGVFINTTGGVKYFQHGGANEGFRSQYYGSLEGGNGVVVMVNSDNGNILSEVIAGVATVYGWTGFYHPAVKTIFPLKPEELTAYEGQYKYRGTRPLVLQVAAREDHLLIKQVWDGQEIGFYLFSDTSFFSRDANFEIKFARGADGKFATVSAFGRDFFDRVKQ
jgi:CubicO group peptidase (beta-lactamase class C family)